MRRSLVWNSLAGAALSLAAPCASATFAQQAVVGAVDAEQAARGKILFEREWAIKDPLTPQGDGVGPMRNANSCVACHFQGAVGGGGPNEKNVQLLTLSRKQDAALASSGGRSTRTPNASRPPLTLTDMNKRVDKLHSNFVTTAGLQTSIVFHRFGSGADYELWRDQFLGVPLWLVGPDRQKAIDKAYHKVTTQHVLELAKEHTQSVALLLSERNTPALFGAHLIDSISADAVRALAAEQTRWSNEISGKVPPAKNNDVGRFGWRGQTPTLKDFVLGACAIELGLSTPETAQLFDPRVPFSMAHVQQNPDLSAEQCFDLTAFCASLPAPQEQRPLEGRDAEFIAMGQAHFKAIGCEACHRQTVAHVVGIYSDLLLHDLGDELRDPVPGVGESLAPTYYGGDAFDIFASTAAPQSLNEWRTPPLWGVADSAPYMHDGRAANLEQAILAHGGEAAATVRRFQSLHRTSRTRLLAFLNSLRAPGVTIAAAGPPTPASGPRNPVSIPPMSRVSAF